MRYLSKINRGAILTAIVIFAVICYLTADYIIERQEIPRVKQVCDTYLQTQVGYSMLPSEYRISDPKMSEADLKTYLGKMEKDLTAFYPETKQYQKYLIRNLTDNLTAQAAGIGVIYKFEKSIIKYNSLLFDGSVVNVTFTSNTLIEGDGADIKSGSGKQKITTETQDNIILQKVNGSWRVIYANIANPLMNNDYGKIAYAYKQ